MKKEEILKDTLNRLNSFAKQVEQIHEEDLLEIENFKENNNLKKKKKQTLLNFDNNNKNEYKNIINKLILKFSGKFNTLEILISLHKNAGNIEKAIQTLLTEKIEQNPLVLMDLNYIQSTEEEKFKYLKN